MVQAVWPGSSQLLGLCGRGLSVAWMVQAVWPGSSQLLGWFRLCGQGLVSCLDGSGCVARGLVSCLDGSGCVAGVGLVSCLDGSGCVARV